jgi:hypothetical protein
MFSRLTNKMSGRKGTKQQVAQRLPPAPVTGPTPVVQSAVPTYDHVDKQTGPVDKDKEDAAAVDDSIAAAAGRSAAATTGPTDGLKPPSKTVVRNVQNTQAGTSSTPTTAISYFAKYWTDSLGYDVEPVVHFELNEWTPNSLALFDALRNAAPYVTNNRYIQLHHPEYIDYATVCYYAIIFYIQILRAREASQAITGEESTFLRRFRRAYPEEKLVISEVVAPILSSIVATQLEDAQFDWIVPRIATELFSPTMSDTSFVDSGSHYLQPVVPYMLSSLCLFIHPAMKVQMFSTVTGHDTESHYFNDSDQFVPGAFTDNKQTRRLWGQNFTVGTAADRNSLLAAAGLSHPFFSDNDNLLLALPSWNRSRFMDIKTLPAQPNANAAVAALPGYDTTGTTPISNLEQYLFMPKAKNISWFQELLKNANTHARFFSTQVNLSDIPVTGGNETLILANFKREGTRYQSTAADYAGIQAPLPAADLNWYPRPFDHARAGFTTTIASPTREETLQAMTFGVNGTLPVTINDAAGNPQRIGTIDAQRSGPFFAQKDFKQTYATDHEGLVIGAAKPMFEGFSTMMQEKMRLVKPKGLIN